MIKKLLLSEKENIRKKLNVLTIFFGFSLFVNAQCPSSLELYFDSQQDVDQFKINYPNCTKITGLVDIRGADITNLNGLSNITSIDGSFLIRQTHNLSNLEGLNNLESIGGYLNINSNTALTSLAGLNNLKTIAANLTIQANPVLANLDGLNKLESLNYYLNIQSNAALSNLNGLSNLSTVKFYMLISNNASINNISGVANVNTSGITILYITENPKLPVCNLPNICAYLKTSNPRTINGNLANCLDEQAVNSACATLSVAADIDKSELKIYPNPVKEILNFSEDVSEIKITDLSGKLVKHISFKGKALNLVNLEKGSYIITATTKSGKPISRKIVKE